LSGCPGHPRQQRKVALTDHHRGNAAQHKETTTMTMVCAWCDVYCRVERVHTDATTGEIVMHDTVCAYCGRGELRVGKLGRQTPLPEDDAGGADQAHVEQHWPIERIAADMFNSETRRGWLANKCSCAGDVPPDISEEAYVALFVEKYRDTNIDKLEEMADFARPSNMPTAYEREAAHTGENQ
jgi:hypothetical protein